MPCNLPKAIKEPVKVKDPITVAKAIDANVNVPVMGSLEYIS